MQLSYLILDPRGENFITPLLKAYVYIFSRKKALIMRHQDAVYNWSVKLGITIEFWHLTKLFSQLKIRQEKSKDFPRII